MKWHIFYLEPCKYLKTLSAFSFQVLAVSTSLLASLFLKSVLINWCVCRCWALALFGGNSETGFDQNTTYSIFSISITLTDEGFQNFYQVKKTILHLSLLLNSLFLFLLYIQWNSETQDWNVNLLDFLFNKRINNKLIYVHISCLLHGLWPVYPVFNNTTGNFKEVICVISCYDNSC